MQQYPYGAQAPPPPPPPIVPYMGDMVYEIAVPSSPTGSPTGRGSKSPYIVYGSDERGKQYHYEDRSRLAVGRSSSTKERRAASVHVGHSGRDRSRPRSAYYAQGGRYDDEYDRYGGRGHYYPESNYSSSSRGSRDDSRPPPRRYHSPSTHSEAGYDYAPYPPGPAWNHPPASHPPGMVVAPIPPPPPVPGQALMPPGSMVPWQAPPNPATEELNKKIEALQLELDKSKQESERIRIQKEQEELQKKKEEELKAAVQRELESRRKAEEAAARAAEEEKRKIEAAAKQLLEEQKAKDEAAEKARKEEEARIAAAAAKLAEDQLKESKMMLDLRKPTHTKFSKTHLCKEALDERKISYTEHEDSFLVHRWVDRDEQNALWARTKEIRAYQLDYQRRFKEEADKAPVIDTPNGPVKIVKVGNNPPVTVPVVLVTKKAPVQQDVKFKHIFNMR